jgi:hypothetical protein
LGEKKKMSEEETKEEEEEGEMIKVAEALEQFVNALPFSLANDVRYEDVLDAVLYNAYEEVDGMWMQKEFDLSNEEAEDFLYWAFNWETDIEGAEGGIALYYSRATGWYYFFTGRYWKPSGKFAVGLYKLEKAALKEHWIPDGHFLDALQEGTAFQLK